MVANSDLHRIYFGESPFIPSTLTSSLLSTSSARAHLLRRDLLGNWLSA